MPKLGRRSEMTELDHQRGARTQRDAPFGTESTPTYRPRIIGGNMVNVIERPSDVNLPRYEKLSLVSDKPNNVDPRALTDFNRRYNVPYKQSPRLYDPFALAQTQPALISRRPDSKDIARRYPTLAPIDANRIRNHGMTTVFEPEAWTGRYRREDGPRASLSHSMNGYPRSPSVNSNSGYYNNKPPSSNSSHEVNDESFKMRLLTMIPRGVFLPEVPIVLPQKDEMRLQTMLATELYHGDPLKLRDVYLDISNTGDKQLSGYCQYQDLFSSLTRVGLKLPADLLQLVSAMFVSDHRNQRDVNYEKFLSFVGVAMKSRDKVPPPNNSSNKQFYEKRGMSPIRHRPGAPFFGDGGEGKLLRMVESQLNENEFVIDIERLIHTFQEEDREVRGTLSADQIKDVCFRHRLPLQESLIVSLLQRCDNSNGVDDEQYKWRSFVGFLERVQPVNTGLPIPTSKRPLEYAKLLPQPGSNWPKSERSSPRRPPPRASSFDHEPDPHREIISRMDQDLRELENNYEPSQSSVYEQDLKTKSSRREKDDQPWFKSFMQFADALYQQDGAFDGTLPYTDVADWTKIYNESLHLDIPDHIVSSALSQCTKGGKVDIHQYLSVLGKQGK